MPSAILAQIMRDYGVHLLPDFPSEVADFLAFQVHAEDTRYLGRKVMYLVAAAPASGKENTFVLSPMIE